jgi:pyruvate-formate lyase-activating enzyme
MLKDFRIDVNENDMSRPPERLLDFEEVLHILDQVELRRVLLEGQEASLDPMYGHISQTLHKKYGCSTTLLTNGHKLPDLAHTDMIEFGIKCINDHLHKDYTGYSNKQILANIVDAYFSGKKIFAETVLIPGYIDIDETEHVAEFLSSIDKNIPLVLLPYFQSGFNPWRRPTVGEMDKAAEIARRHLKNVYRFTGDEELLYEVVCLFPKGVDDCPDPLQTVKEHANGKLHQELEEILSVAA